MQLSKDNLYLSAKCRWPSSFSINYNSSTNYSVDVSPSDLDVYKEIEKSIDVDDDWAHISAWSFHQALGMAIKRAAESGAKYVKTDDVLFDDFHKMMMENLSHESWFKEFSIYSGLS